MAELQLQLLKEEAVELSGGRARQQGLAGSFFHKAFDIENCQYVLVPDPYCQHAHGIHRCILDAKTKAKTTTASSQAQILELCNTLSRNLTKLWKSQHILMPGLAPLLENDDDQDEIKLWLPSELPNAD